MRTCSELPTGSLVVVTLFIWYRTTGGGAYSPPIDAGDFRNGEVGGERGCCAAALNFRLAVETVAAVDPDGENRKTRAPNDRRAARMRVIGLARRMARGMAI